MKNDDGPLIKSIDFLIKFALGCWACFVLYIWILNPFLFTSLQPYAEWAAGLIAVAALMVFVVVFYAKTVASSSKEMYSIIAAMSGVFSVIALISLFIFILSYEQDLRVATVRKRLEARAKEREQAWEIGFNQIRAQKGEEAAWEWTTKFNQQEDIKEKNMWAKK